MGGSQVTIELTADEALVLSHWLEELQMTDLSRVVDDPAVWAPIHRIAGTLDKALPELFGPIATGGLRRLVSGCGRRSERSVRLPQLAVAGWGS
nr:hypothetical protein [Streptomyces sp. McG3]